MSAGNNMRSNSVIGGLLLLLLRGILLWLTVPLAICAWPFAYVTLSRSGVKFGQFLGWVDLNLMAFLSRIVLRLLFRDPLPWVPWREMSRVTHRLRFIDAA